MEAFEVRRDLSDDVFHLQDRSQQGAICSSDHSVSSTPTFGGLPAHHLSLFLLFLFETIPLGQNTIGPGCRDPTLDVGVPLQVFAFVRV